MGSFPSKHINVQVFHTAAAILSRKPLCPANRYYYDGNKTKNIRDYGLLGTYGLEAIHQIFIDAKNAYPWVLVEEADGFL